MITMIRKDVSASAREGSHTADDRVIDKLSSLLNRQGVSARDVIAVAQQHTPPIADIETVTLSAIKRSVYASVDDAIRELRKNTLEGVATAIVLTAAVLIMNIQLRHILTYLFVSRRMGLLVSAVVTAPLLEELFKHFSIKRKATASYFIAFNLQEFSAYVTLGVSPHLRLPAVIMHLVTTLIQKHFCMLADKSNEDDRTRIENKGYLGAVLVHAMFNAVVLRKPG